MPDGLPAGSHGEAQDRSSDGGGARQATGRVPTVFGQALLEGAGTLVDAHAHAWIDPPAGVATEHVLDLTNEDLQATALHDWAAAAEHWAPDRVEDPRDLVATSASAGGAWPAGLIDCQPPFAGRDAKRLAAVSRRSGVAIACVTGFHLARYYPDGQRPWTSSEAATAFFVDEVATGLSEAPERQAAAIKAAHSGRVSDDLAAWEAAVAAQQRTGACLLVHTERGAGAEDLVAWLLERGVPSRRIFLCHIDKRPDLELHVELAQAGVLLGYDTFVRPQYRPEVGVWPLLRALLDRDLGAAVAVCLDLAVPAMWSEPHAGPLGFMALAQRLDTEIGHGSVLDGLLGGNVLRTLARSPERGVAA